MAEMSFNVIPYNDEIPWLVMYHYNMQEKVEKALENASDPTRDPTLALEVLSAFRGKTKITRETENKLVEETDVGRMENIFREGGVIFDKGSEQFEPIVRLMKAMRNLNLL
jgi:hypothetical protein